MAGKINEANELANACYHLRVQRQTDLIRTMQDIDVTFDKARDAWELFERAVAREKEYRLLAKQFEEHQ